MAAPPSLRRVPHWSSGSRKLEVLRTPADFASGLHRRDGVPARHWISASRIYGLVNGVRGTFKRCATPEGTHRQRAVSDCGKSSSQEGAVQNE
jgi:hypothetical protein